jgi:hypothetical protein
VDLKGQHVYPGVIAPATNLGLVEYEKIRDNMDFKEIGDINPSVRSLIAYNTDSKLIYPLRSNGTLLAQVAPQGDLLSGTSSIVQLDAWNWEDAAYKADDALHFYIPRINPNANPGVDPVRAVVEQIESVRLFFLEAKAYLRENQHNAVNLKYEAMRPLFSKEQKLFVHCNMVKEMLVAVDFAKTFDIQVVIVGGADAWMITDILKQFQIPVILATTHSLPLMPDDSYDQPYKTASQLQQAGVLFCLGPVDHFWLQRNLIFGAGTASTYGLSKEEALAAVTLNTAKILGIEKQTGSLETGKDANIIVSKGDLLDMRSSVITRAFIQGREINLDNEQKQLYEKYKIKYGLK